MNRPRRPWGLIIAAALAAALISGGLSAKYAWESGRVAGAAQVNSEWTAALRAETEKIKAAREPRSVRRSGVK